MSWALVRPLAVAATGLIVASAVEKGFRSGPKRGDTELSLNDANTLLNTSMTSSDDYFLDKAGGTIRKQFFMNTGILASLTRGKNVVKSIFSRLTDNIIPLGIAVGSIFTGGAIGAVGLGVLGLWGAFNAVKYSGLVKNRGSNVLDIKM